MFVCSDDDCDDAVCYSLCIRDTNDMEMRAFWFLASRIQQSGMFLASPMTMMKMIMMKTMMWWWNCWWWCMETHIMLCCIGFNFLNVNSYKAKIEHFNCITNELLFMTMKEFCFQWTIWSWIFLTVGAAAGALDIYD